jgi:hypothetical protein
MTLVIRKLLTASSLTSHRKLLTASSLTSHRKLLTASSPTGHRKLLTASSLTSHQKLLTASSLTNHQKLLTASSLTNHQKLLTAFDSLMKASDTYYQIPSVHRISNLEFIVLLYIHIYVIIHYVDFSLIPVSISIFTRSFQYHILVDFISSNKSKIS